MKFDELDAKMRAFETAYDRCVPAEDYMVARIDGRNFTRLTKEKLPLEAPFDVRFRDGMLATTEHLMNCGFRVIYGYVQSDEISLLFHRDETSFSRKVRKFNSILAGEASAKFSLVMEHLACFDCRISELPSVELVRDYFRWRHEDAHRNALNAHCYWTLRKRGKSVRAATDAVTHLSTEEKTGLLSSHGIAFAELPPWQRRGVGLVWRHVEVEGHNPVTGQRVSTLRRRLTHVLELPLGEDYSEFLLDIVRQSEMETSNRVS